MPDLEHKIPHFVKSHRQGLKYPVENLQLYVGILMEICSVCRKMAIFCLTYYYNPRRCLSAVHNIV